jgi:hypothetical protein
MNIEKSPYSKFRWQGRVQKNCPFKSKKHSEVQGRRNIQKGRTSTKQTIKQDWQSLKCSGTISSDIYDSNYSITNYPLTSSAPYNSYEPVQPLAHLLSFCCKSTINKKTQPWYWLAPYTTEGKAQRKHRRRQTKTKDTRNHKRLAIF